ncbi:MAG: ABC transporter permease [Actinomycetota bacterium]|nr:ABC transporter permease [Actinomycetota bacterium]
MARRLVSAVGTLFGVSLVVFLVLRALPGDEITARFGIEAGALTPKQIEALRSYYGLDRSLIVQYLSWMQSVFAGNLGVSVTSGNPVSTLIANAIPVTLELAILSTAIGTLLGVAIGVFAAARANRLGDTLGQVFGMLGLAVPSFILGSVIVAVLAARFGYFPSAAGYVGFFEDPWINLQQQLYPALTLGTGLAATTMRTTRSAYLEAAGQDFARTARGKGLSEWRVRWRHILHNAAVPILTITGIQFGYLLGGTVIVEQIFALPGLGRLVLIGISQREYAVVQSTVLVIAAAFVLANLAVDLLYARLDPRVRLT